MNQYSAHHRLTGPSDTANQPLRITIAVWLFFLGFGLIVARLFFLMVWEHDFYKTLASTVHESSAKLVPKRGQIYLSDARTGVPFPVALNDDVYTLYADTREIKTAEQVQQTLNFLATTFNYSSEKKVAVEKQLSKKTDPYEPLEQKLDQAKMEMIKAQDLPGLAFVREPHRRYPEGVLAASVLGFVGKNQQGTDQGRYGIEGYWHQNLSGTGGFVEGLRSASGGLVQSGSRQLQLAQDGTDLVLTIDRTIQYQACERLRRGLVEYGASSASLVIMEPKTGAILAMCSLPDFNPNDYSKVTNAGDFNNSTIFTAYEPGSIFKPIAMSAAINEGIVSPSTPFFDSGRRDGICQQPIQNAGNKSFGDQTMTGVLQNSINTGMVYVAEQLGKTKFDKYIKRFGFGVETGIELDTEVGGTIQSLEKNKGNKFDCYTATASFGQGLTVTPLQMATAFSVIANGGTLMKPYIVKEKRFSDGHTETTKPKSVGTVLTRKAASQVGTMLVATVDKGYSGRARVAGYRVAGKSGTAEIAGPGGYTKTYNHSFIGFAPAQDPKFVMVVKYEKPTAAYAESTAAPVFGELSKFMLEYLQVPPEK